ncbi:MAG: hypothetical protein LUD41_00335 [Phascolarctobacterium sp.]|nr:hypothetical protein [Phascolarctobacterium sp.]
MPTIILTSNNPVVRPSYGNRASAPDTGGVCALANSAYGAAADFWNQAWQFTRTAAGIYHEELSSHEARESMRILNEKAIYDNKVWLDIQKNRQGTNAEGAVDELNEKNRRERPKTYG